MAVKRISDFNIKRRGVLSGIYGNTRNPELFLDKDLCACNISRALYHYLKEENYRVVFYDPLKDKGFWSYSEQDLADFFCLNPIGHTSSNATQGNTSNQVNHQSNLIDNGSYVRQGENTSYVPKINTPFGKLKPRFGPRNQASGQAQNASDDNRQPHNKTNLNTTSGGFNNGNIVCHYAGIYYHNDGKNGFFKCKSSSNGFEGVFSNVEKRYRTPVVIVYENPENIKPQNPDEIENEFANFIKTYAEKKLKFKIVVVFGSENKRQLAYDFERERGGMNSIFFRRSFALRFGLAPSTQNPEEDHENKVNFEKNMYQIGLPEKDEIANLLIRKRICEGLKGTLSPKPFDSLVRSISLGNYKVPDSKGRMVHPSEAQRLIYILSDSNLTNLTSVIETIDSGDAEKQLKKRIGAKPVVTQIERLLKMMVKERQLKEKTGKEPLSPTRPHMAFIGNPGTGKTTLARLVAQWFREKNVLSKGHFVEAKASDLIDDVVGGTRMKTAAKCEEAMGGILFVDEAYGLHVKEGVNYEAEAQEVLLQYMEKPDFCLIIAGYKNEIESLLAPPNNPGLHERFVRSNIITFEDYKPKELYEIMMQKIDFDTTPAFREAIEEVLKRLYRRRDENWANARSVENIWQEIRALFYEDEGDNNVIDKRHIPIAYIDLIDDTKGDDAEQQLRSRIGMVHIANQVGDLMTIILAEQRLEEKTGKKSSSPVRPHMVFLGNPGTGKTTAAKLIGRWFRDKNVLTKGHFVETKASDLIDNVVGGTRIKTSAKCEEAMGGILFVDEAYGLCVKKDNHSQVSYEAEAQEILLQYMEKPDFLLILAGYTDQINELMQAPNNPGLRGRFTNSSFIQFRDYEPQELFDILMQKIDYNTTSAFRDSMKAILEVCYRRRTSKWANARSIENIWQEIRGLFYKSGATEVDVCHIPQEYLKMIDTTPKSSEEIFGGLDKMIGLGHVVEQIKDIYASVLDDNNLRAAGEPTSDSTLFFIFQGPPGTGKTTVARMLGKIFFDMGILASPVVDEKSKADFTSKYLNESENNLSDLFDKNLGGTLFIDEAYMLDKEHADVINQKLTSPKYMGKMAVILAGYKEDMNMWLSHNSGLRGRNWNYVNFESYTNEELWAILQQLMESKHRMFQPLEQCHKLALAWFGLLPRTKDFANARESRRLFELLQKNKTKRLATSCDVKERLIIIPEDFPKKAHEALVMNEDLLGERNAVDSQEPTSVDRGTPQPRMTIDFTQEDTNLRATCVEHLEHSVGLLSCSSGSDDTVQGTAFIISLHNHYLLTCSHVVEGKTQFTFSISEFKFETPARLLWNNSQCDMALLQVGILPQEARYLQLCQEEKPVGKTTKITLAGYPLGEAVSRNLMINSGEITNYEANKQNNDRRFDSYMSDINATHGNSGGPVVRQSDYQIIGLLQGGFEQVQVRLITDIRQLYKNIDIKQ